MNVRYEPAGTITNEGVISAIVVDPTEVKAVEVEMLVGVRVEFAFIGVPEGDAAVNEFQLVDVVAALTVRLARPVPTYPT